MKKSLIFFVAAASVLLSIGFLLSQQDFSKVQIKARKVTDNIYMLQGSGGNIGVSVGPDGILMIDDQYAPLAPKIEAALKDLSSGSLKYVLNTHFHGDHTGGNEVFGKSSTIVAHANVRKRLSTEQMRRGQPAPPKPREAWPVITFDTSISVHFNGEEIRAMHYPQAHTDGDAVIYFVNSNVVHMGDTFFAGIFPYIDIESGGSVQGLIAAVGHVIENVPADVKLIPGHGELSTLDDLKAYHDMLQQTSALVEQKIADGKTLETIKAEGLPGQWQVWANGFINEEGWLEALYNSLQKM
ncbi:MAG: MBL fold metallo-hydrolase [Deferribacteres bacterium]|nr:MBL fold metallo-hydrolase [candidate division KSB1 bacterium]MCB9511309.1 MBL fold metallo-hydrolase [Deferribacteres bacterium]